MAAKHSARSIIRSSLWFYLRSITNLVGGFIYWLIISVIAGASVVGLTSATVSLALLIANIVLLGTETSVQKFIGHCIGRKDRECVSRYFWSTFAFIIAASIVSAAILFALGLEGLSYGRITPQMLVLAGLIVLLNVFNAFDSLLIAHLEVKPVFLGAVLGQLARIPLGAFLVFNGWGWVGATIGYMILAPVGFLAKIRPSLRLLRERIAFSLKALSSVIRAGLALWVPSIVTVLGQQLGVLLAFGFRGAVEAGLYYIAFMVMNIVTGIGSAALSIMMPVLSSMSQGRERAAARAIRLSIAIVMPLAASLAVYPSLVLGLLGREFEGASQILSVLTLSIPAFFVANGVTSLLYAYGFYRPVLVIGLASNISRIALYAPLASMYGGIGIASSYTVGAYLGFLPVIMYSRRVGFNPGYREAFLATLIPLALAMPLILLGVPWYIGLPLLLSSYILYLWLGLLQPEDIRDLAYALLPRMLAKRVYQGVRGLIEKLRVA